MYAELYFADVSCLKDEELYRALYEKMPEDRRAAADRLRFDGDRRLSVGALSLLRYALAKRGERAVFPIFSGEHGKPYFSDRRDVFFNLSHSGDVALCALSDREIGCDVEKIRRPPLRVADKYFSEEEREYVLSAETDDERRERFFRVWTLKESVLKASGDGFTVSASSFSALGVCFPPGTGEAFSPLAVFLVRGYASALCVRGEETVDPAIGRIDLKALDC